ncbi:hypothetical protein J2S00_000222 [Caldalkalibacillus uzonensis]|uniref:VWA domain-containing protein n=1 Tax=Caldalkalibacillus uzonensis TaxID=353224 RepID=A0ABU0CMS3_9BACI|nr:BatA and WFA domain-containing protein [Caldalkalibacillus uzonensis]MDQ0337452.1 hypothetical protein [Caldalkalibacillus uzonensis]
MQWLGLQHLWAVALIPIILLLYLLKRKYENVEVSSTLLWERVLQHQQASRPWQKLKQNILLFLQLFVAMLLILALLKPAIPKGEVLAPHTIVVLDSSGSMLTREGETTRFEKATEAVQGLAEGVSAAHTLTLIEAGREPVVHLSRAEDPDEILQKLKELKPRPGTSNYSAAFSLAKAMAEQEPDTALIWIGDGSNSLGNNSLMNDRHMFTFDPNRFQHIPVGKESENVALGTFVTQEREGKIEGLIRIDHHGHQTIEGKVMLFDAAGQQIGVFPFTVEGQESYTLHLPSLPPSPLYHAVVEADQDALEADNQLWSIPFRQQEIRVALVSPQPNYFVIQALSLHPHIQLDKLSAPPEDLQGYDIWIFDEVVPDVLPEGHLFLINPAEESSWLSVSEAQTLSAELNILHPDHDILNHVHWQDVYISDARSIALNGLQQNLVQAGDLQLLSAGEINHKRVVVLGFDLTKSDLPLRPSFPILITNILTWLSPVQSLPIADSYPGEQTVIPFVAGSENRTLTGPDGSRTTLPDHIDPVVVQIPELLGLYTVEEEKDGQRNVRHFSVKLPDSESNIAPQTLYVTQDATSLANENGELESEKREGDASGEGETVEDNHEPYSQIRYQPLVFWVVLAALLLACLEWGVYVRGY